MPGPTGRHVVARRVSAGMPHATRRSRHGPWVAGVRPVGACAASWVCQARRAARSAVSRAAPSAMRLALAASRVRSVGEEEVRHLADDAIPDQERVRLRRRASARPGEPAAARAMVRARVASARPSSTSSVAMASVLTGPSRTRAERLVTVGRMLPESSAHSTMHAAPTGSSSVLSSAFWASGLRRCADSMSAKRSVASMGISASSDASAWTCGSRICSPAPSGARRCRSGWFPCATLRHAGHSRQGRSIGSSAVHRSPAARSSARVVLPTPGGPTTRTDCGGRPVTIARRTPASASGWPRVRNRPASLRMDRLSPHRSWPRPWWSDVGSAWRWPRRPPSPARGRARQRPWWSDVGSAWRGLGGPSPSRGGLGSALVVRRR